MSANAGKKQGHRFQQGQSGNPAGKPKGTRHRVTMLAQRMMEDDAAEVVAAVVAAAKDGDMSAAKLVIDRLVPPRKDSPVNFDLPAIKSASDASAAMAAVLGATAAGDLTPAEASEIAKLIDVFTRTHEACELEKRIVALEERGQK